MLSFVIPGKVQAKQSVKFANVGGFVRKYTPKEMVNYANWVKQCFCTAYPNHSPASLEGKALVVNIAAYFEVPKSFSKKKRAQALTNAIRPTKKPDCDNISKNILDALNKIAYPDDSQIACLHVRKYYTERDYVTVTIEDTSLF